MFILSDGDFFDEDGSQGIIDGVHNNCQYDTGLSQKLLFDIITLYYEIVLIKKGLKKNWDDESFEVKIFEIKMLYALRGLEKRKCILLLLFVLFRAQKRYSNKCCWSR